MNQDKLSCWFLALTVGVTACDGPAPMPDAGARDSGVDAAVAYCTAARECTDDLFCNGIESCAPQAPGTDARGCLAGTPPCSAEMVCNEATDHCDVPCAEEDADGDNELSHACGGTDCDDHDGTRFSLHGETCDAVDNDCRPETLAGDDGDVDHDGAISAACCNTQDDGTTLCGTDCDDTRTGEFRDTVESCGVCGRSCFLACGADLECDEIIQLSAGDEHVCGVRRSGGIACWGKNDAGQLGDGTTTNSSTPVEVGGITDAVEVAAGAGFTCALRAGGGVSCWGANAQGQTGSGSTLYTIAAPIDVRSGVGTILTGVTHIAAGFAHACAATDSGEVYCWGADGAGQVDGPPADSRWIYARQVEAITNAATVVAADAHSCALLADGTARCWGSNGGGQLGDGVSSHNTCGSSDCAAPVQVALADISAIAAGGGRTCAIHAGALSCWGSGLGNTPAAITGATEVHHVAVGAGHACIAHGPDSTVACWGGNDVGQLGTGDQDSRADPADIALSGAAALTIGGAPTTADTCALEESGRVTCWGSNRSLQVGDGSASHPSCDMAYFWGDCSPSPSMLARPAP